MIWAVLFIAVVASSYWLMSPWLTDQAARQDTELAEARAQLAVLEAEAEAGVISSESAAQGRAALERRVLALLDSESEGTPPSDRRRAILWGVPGLIGVGSLVVYALVGAPSLVPQSERQLEAESRLAFERDVASLAQQLADDPEARYDGYIVLARGYMGLDQYDAALSAYQSAYERSGEAADVLAEMQSARDYIARQTGGPSKAQMDAIQALPQDDQQAMILGMVEGLAARLQDDPNDPQGWVRLVRSRLVLGQVEQAVADIGVARAALANSPELRAEFESGIAPLAAELDTLLVPQNAQASSTP